MNRAERLRAAQAWLSAQSVQSAPSWEDVQLIAAMDIHDVDVLQQLLLRDSPRLVARWHDLTTALHAVSGRRPPTAESPPASPQPTLIHAPDPPQVIEQVEQPEPEPPATTDERLSALTRWRDEAATAQPALQGLSDVDLLRIARSMARSIEEIRELPLRAKQLAIDHAVAISGVLRGARSPSGVGRPEPVAVVPGGSPGVARSLPHLGQSGDPARSATAESSAAIGSGHWAGTPAAPSPRPTSNGSARQEGWLGDPRFAPFSWTLPADTGGAVPLTASAIEGDRAALVLSWPPSVHENDGWFAYRVVSSDEYPPISSPDLFDQVGATRRTTCADVRAARSAVRHYSIWINHGPDEASARAAQPRLHAVGQAVARVQALRVRVDGERVFGRWDALPGTSRVAVMRLPEAEADHRPGYHAAYTFPDTLRVNDTGFTDVPAEGGSFVYRVFAIADVAGADVWSPGVQDVATIAANVEEVADLAVTREADDTLTVSWTPPSAGRVEIYRLASAPAGSLPGTLLSREALAPHLPGEHQLIQPSDRTDGRATMTDVRMPAGWIRACFVPVTVLDERHLRVGRPAVLILPLPPTDLRCVERVRAQIVTFAWPDGVDLVRVLSGPRATDAGAAGAMPLAELTREQYDEQGGIHLANPLPADGCALHAYGVTYHVGKPILSVPVSIEYPGLYRLRYQILRRAAVIEAPARGGLFGRSAQPAPASAAPVSIAVQVNTSHRLDRVRVLLVHHPSRLPLHSHDGTSVLDQEVTLTPADSPTLEPGIGPEPGYLRLFVTGTDPTRPPVAVLDPPVTTLRLS